MWKIRKSHGVAVLRIWVYTQLNVNFRHEEKKHEEEVFLGAKSKKIFIFKVK